MFASEVQPILTGVCVACHASPTSAGPGFLQPMPDLYSTVTSWPNLVKGGAPNDSRLYTYPTSSAHLYSGTNLTTAQAAKIRQWIEIVPVAGAEDDTSTETQLLTPMEGSNEVPLDGLGDGLSGARLTFSGDQLSAGFLITDLAAHAGDGGLHLVHPLFIVWCEGEPTPIDAFDGVDLEVEPNQQGTVGGGTLSLSSFIPGCRISIHFELLEPALGGGGGGGDGGGPLTGACTAVASFTASAQPPLGMICANCHGGTNATATNAMDLSEVRDLAPAAQANACAQVRSNVNLAMPEASILLQRPIPGQMTGHPFEFASAAEYAAFRNAILAWVVNETP